MNDGTFGVNVHQDIQGCVEEFNKMHEPEPEDTPDPHEPSKEAEKYVAKGRLDPETGAEIPLTSKARTVVLKQFGTVSQEYADNYERTFGHP